MLMYYDDIKDLVPLNTMDTRALAPQVIANDQPGIIPLFWPYNHLSRYLQASVIC